MLVFYVIYTLFKRKSTHHAKNKNNDNLISREYNLTKCFNYYLLDIILFSKR